MAGSGPAPSSPAPFGVASPRLLLAASCPRSLRGGGRDAAHLAVQWPFGRSSCTARAVQEVARSFPDGRGCQGLDLERDGDASWVSVTTPTAAEVGEETGIAEGQATTRRLVPMNPVSRLELRPGGHTTTVRLRTQRSPAMRGDGSGEPLSLCGRSAGRCLH